MFRLEKSSCNSLITITFKQRESTFNSLFLKAFFLALLIHFIILLLFHIQPFLIKAEFIHTPTQVQMDYSGISRLTLSDEESKDPAPDIPLPSISTFLDAFPLDIQPPLGLFEIDLELWNNPFSDLEDQLTIHQPPTLPIPFTHSPIKLFISGGLANRPLKKYDSRIDERLPYVPTTNEPLYATYEVHVDSHGKVFWYEMQAGPDSVNRLAEELISSLLFEASAFDFNSKGTVDFVIH